MQRGQGGRRPRLHGAGTGRPAARDSLRKRPRQAVEGGKAYLVDSVVRSDRSETRSFRPNQADIPSLNKLAAYTIGTLANPPSRQTGTKEAVFRAENADTEVTVYE